MHNLISEKRNNFLYSSHVNHYNEDMLFLLFLSALCYGYYHISSGFIHFTKIKNLKETNINWTASCD